jgi:hypothetical protein
MVGAGYRRALVDPKRSSSRWLDSTRVVPGHCGAISTAFQSPTTPSLGRNEIVQFSRRGQARPNVATAEKLT